MANARTYLRGLCDEMVALQRPLRILKAINWGRKVHDRFFARKARELPQVEYAPLGYDALEIAQALTALKRRIRGRNPLEELLRAKCDELVLIARMLRARGTPAFHTWSVRLYGHPRDRYAAHPNVDNLKVARLWAGRPPARDEKPLIDSATAVDLVRSIVAPHLGRACRVRESSRLTANAAAGATTISVRRGAFFTPRQARALAHHEGLWHVLTSLNGLRQPVLPVLGLGLPRSTESQEGGGIVAEFLSGNITDDRYIELGERTIAVDMAARGADFLEVYRYLAQRFEPQRAAQLAERVFRGGVITGGAPFTKDAVYQRGYCRTYNFIRIALSRPEHSRLLAAFLAGKMRVDDTPLVADLIEEGLAAGPAYLPEWYLDQDRLHAFITHSITVNRFSIQRGRRYFEERLAQHDLAAWDLEGLPEGELPAPEKAVPPVRAESARKPQGEGGGG